MSIQPPKGSTLVNLPTIMSTQQTHLDQTVTLLGVPVHITASPISYHWNHGDGTSQTTSTPGQPWPATDITHNYLKPAHHLNVSVDITFHIDYQIAGSAWQSLNQTITTTGPPTPLRVREAIPVLTNGDSLPTPP